MGTGRWGIGLLERNRSSEAKPTEAMQLSNVGLFSTKSEDGSMVVSHDYMTRFTRTYSDFKKALASAGNAGNIVKIDISDTEPAVLLEPGRVYSAAEEAIADSKVSFIQFYFDISVVEKENGVPMPIVIPNVKLNLTTAHNKETETGNLITLDLPVTKLNERVIVPDYTGYEIVSDKIDNNLVLENFEVTLPDVDETEFGIILHALLVGFKEVA